MRYTASRRSVGTWLLLPVLILLNASWAQVDVRRLKEALWRAIQQLRGRQPAAGDSLSSEQPLRFQVCVLFCFVLCFLSHAPLAGAPPQAIGLFR